ncbi:hypothetical protein PC128_g9452 [Phytophthora cactorum]|nr:hypothetical protein PC120_g707 [Phytophthora cactorum]KAG3194315.1 hypothetical protein PC128_g9452 [Phytophthora cactorum]KAG4058410.1 hypothetical protein PC123_g6621 [Phytophthora cactorum]
MTLNGGTAFPDGFDWATELSSNAKIVGDLIALGAEGSLIKLNGYYV